MEGQEEKNATLDKCCYGREIREKHYRLRKGSTYLNHGGFGMVPIKVKEAQFRYIDEMDLHPDDWFRWKSWDLWVKARNVAADFVNADRDDVMFVHNTTTGINSILKSYSFSPNDAILATDHTYLPVQFACRDVASKIPGGKAYFMEMKLSIKSEEDLLENLKHFLESHPDIKFAIIDHITNPTAIKLPVEKMVDMCKKYDVMSIIDGAHAPGQLKLDFKAFEPDFYIGNFHKWGFTPRSCAMMYVNKKHHDWVRPLVTSYYYKDGMVPQFFLQGCHDDVPFLCVPDALKFLEEIGGQGRVTEYNSRLLDKACELLTSLWTTQTLPIPKSMEAPCLRMVRLPPLQDFNQTVEDAVRLGQHIYREHDIQTQINHVQGSLYVRIAAQVYNDFEDFRKLADVICRLPKKPME